MDYVGFESKIPEGTLEILYELGKELHIDPLSSLESENYFCGLLSNFQGKKEELMSYLSEQIKKDFKFYKKCPNGCKYPTGNFIMANPCVLLAKWK